MKKINNLIKILLFGCLTVVLFSCKENNEVITEEVNSETKELVIVDNDDLKLEYHFVLVGDSIGVNVYKDNKTLEDVFYGTRFFNINDNCIYFHINEYNYSTYENKNYICKALDNKVVTKIELKDNVPVGVFSNLNAEYLTYKLIENDKLLFHNSIAYTDLEVDFLNSNYTCNYLLTIDDVNSDNLFNVKSSKNNDYIIQTYGEGGGDYLNTDLFLVSGNNKTIYLGNNGSMYGLNIDCGFLTNGDAYIFSSINFKIYKNGSLYFELADHFPLGILENGNNNVLLAARRNQDGSYIFVYASDNNVDYDKWQKEATYQIVFMDKDGEVLDIVDTNRHLLYSQFGYQELNMYLEDNHLLHFETKVREITSAFTYDIDTKEITVSKEFSDL